MLDREPFPNATQDKYYKYEANYHPSEQQERPHCVATVLARFAYPVRRHPKTVHARVACGTGIADSALVQPICSQHGLTRLLIFHDCYPGSIAWMAHDLLELADKDEVVRVDSDEWG